MLSHDVNEIASAFNQVRYRAGLPGLKAAELNDRDELFEQIKRERMVEFLGEGRRFYDVRRWGIYEDEDSEPIMGLKHRGQQERRVLPAYGREREELPGPRGGQAALVPAHQQVGVA